MLGVVRLTELARGDDEARRTQHEPAALEAGQDLAGEVAGERVRLREDQRALDGHRPRTLAGPLLLRATLGGSGLARSALRPQRQRLFLRPNLRLAVRAHL